MTIPSSSRFDPGTRDLISQGFFSPARAVGSIASLSGLDVLRPLDRGGMGIVYLVRARGDSRLLAMKVLRPEFSTVPAIRNRFLSEIRLMRSLNHEHIVPLIVDVAPRDDQAILMPYYSLGSLGDYLAAERRVDRTTTLQFIIQIATALKHAHLRAVAHRDLSPRNVLLESEERLRVSDFGLAIDFSDTDELFLPRSHCEGTLNYMSPQAARGEKQFFGGDVYSLGAVFYRLLAGVPPYSEVPENKLLKAVASRPPLPISQVNPDADPGMVAVAGKMMAREESDRYATMQDVLMALKECDPSPLSVSIWKSSWNRKVHVFVGVLFVILLVTLGVVFSGADRGVRVELNREFDSELVPSWGRAQLVQWESSPVPELAVLAQATLRVFDLSGVLIDERTIGEGDDVLLKPQLPVDIDFDDQDESTLLVGDEKRLELLVLDPESNDSTRFSVVPSPWNSSNDGFTTEIQPFAAVQSSGMESGRAALFALLGTYYSQSTDEPWMRGVVAFDLADGGILWESLHGPPPCTPRVLDLDRDGLMDVVFGSSAVNNGNVGSDGSTDNRAYAFAVSSSGKLIWRRPLGGANGAVRFFEHRVNSSGAVELYAVVVRGEHGFDDQMQPVCRVVKLDENGQVTREFHSNTDLREAMFLEVGKDGGSRIVTIDRDGRVYLLKDFELDRKWAFADGIPSWTSERDYVDARLLGVGEYTEPGEPLFGVAVAKRIHGETAQVSGKSGGTSFRDSRLHFFNRELDLVGTHELDRPIERFECVDIDSDGRLEIIWMAETVRVLEVENLL